MAENLRHFSGGKMRNLFLLKAPLVLAIGSLLLSISGCDRGLNRPVVKQPGAMDFTPVQVSVVYPSDCRDDFSYCDVLYNGLQKAVGVPWVIDITEMEGSAETWDRQLRRAAQSADLVITAGSQMSDPISRIAPEFPEVKFAIFDAEVELPNVAAFTSKANEGAFLVGAIAGLKTQVGKVGYLGGNDVPLSHQFEAGYIAGVKKTNPDAEIIRGYGTDKEHGVYDPVKGLAIATAQYESGVDIIYAVGNQAEDSTVEAAKMVENRYVIWTYINFTTIDENLYGVIKDCAHGYFTAGVHSLGLFVRDRFFLFEGGVGYVQDEQLAGEILTTIKSLQVSIATGEITVPIMPEDNNSVMISETDTPDMP